MLETFRRLTRPTRELLDADGLSPFASTHVRPPSLALVRAFRAELYAKDESGEEGDALASFAPAQQRPKHQTPAADKADKSLKNTAGARILYFFFGRHTPLNGAPTPPNIACVNEQAAKLSG